MQFTSEQLEQLASALTGTSLQGNGKARRVKAGKKANGMKAVSVADLLKGNPERASSADDIPEDALSCDVNGREYFIYPAEFEGIVGVKCTFMPFRKQFLSLSTLRLLADPDIQTMIATFVAEVDKGK